MLCYREIMKTTILTLFGATLLICATSFLLLASDETPDAAATATGALEVHEWGTFTVLQGSDGNVIEWYQAPDQLVDLPPFVKQPFRIAGKSGTNSGRKDTVRMETPVLYFYPEKEMDVTVTASFPNGRITEVFPPAARPFQSVGTIWHGTLLPPDSPQRKNVPAADGPRGRHYAAAREVPDAWLFRNKPLPVPVPIETDGDADAEPATVDTISALLSTALAAEEKQTDAVEPIDHFIFYRGAGNHSFYELRAVQGKGTDNFTLFNHGSGTIPKIFALRISEGLTSWLELDPLDVVEYDDGKVLNAKTFSFPTPAGPAQEVAGGLRSAMIDSLNSEGLTRAEATAMVNTWDNLWFTEPGTRLLAILPQAFADTMVPLKISPAPKKLERVFVARVEMFTREVEQKLTSLLNNPGSNDASDLAPAAEQLTDLQLGRYAAGGMERAATLIELQIRARFAQLQQTAQDLNKLQAQRD
jgi:hypothetical protein